MNFENTIGNFGFIVIASAVVFPGFYHIHTSKIKKLGEVSKCLIYGVILIISSAFYVVFVKGLQLSELGHVLLFRIEYINSGYPYKLTTSIMCFGYGLILYWLFCVVIVLAKYINRKNV